MVATVPTDETYRVNPTLTPTIWSAFNLIADDLGKSQEWLEAQRVVPPRHAENIYRYERMLRALSAEEFLDFVLEDLDGWARKGQLPDEAITDAFLDDFVNEWED